MRQKLGECLVQAGLIAEDDLQQALAEHKRTGEHLGIVLGRMNLATEEQIAKAVASQLGLPYIDLSAQSLEPDALLLIPQEIARERVCFPVSVSDNVLTVAMDDPLAFSVIEELESHTRHRIRAAVAPRRDILAAVDKIYRDIAPSRADHSTELPAKAAADFIGQTVDLFDRIMKDLTNGVADVHIDPGADGAAVRYRIDGVLKTVLTLPPSIHKPLEEHIKNVASLDLRENRLPQEGRIRNIRVSTLRTIFGEKVVLQPIVTRKTAPALDALGFSTNAVDELRRLMRQPGGLMLFVAPAGHGTTTTVEAVASALVSNATTIPDVLAHGDLNDETLASALDAAGSGCLVLSTLRSDDAASAVQRVISMGAAPGRAAASLIGIVGQRLVRRLCTHCRRASLPSPDVLRTLGVADVAAAASIYEAVGCDECQYTGYRGRTGICEVLRVTDVQRRLIASDPDAKRIRQQAIADGMATIGEEALSRVQQGVTTVDELLRTVGELTEPRTLCGGCGTAVSAEFRVCPRCGMPLDVCAHCGRTVDPGWRYCPYCASGAGRV